MSPSIYDLGIDKLSVADRLRLIDEIYGTLEPADPGAIPEEHWPLIEERLADIEANPDDGLSLEETMALLRAKR
jgi:putative addiction module component (TIGR02574 family)